jgi:hypothetical protein
MTRLVLFLCLIIFVSASRSEMPKSKWISLFNGKDLSGWKVKDQASRTGG